MNEKPAISVIMPVYNAEKYLKEAIASVLNQTFQDFELIIVDDASTDSSLEICRQVCLGRENVKLIHREKNGGQALARNDGMIRSTGKYISFIDADDAYTPAALEIMYKEAEKSQAEVLSSIGYMKDNTPAVFISNLQRPAKLPADIESRIDFFCQGNIPFEVHIKMFRRDFLVKYNLLFDDIALMEDTLFVFYALCLARKFLFIPQIFYRYRQTSESSSRGHKNDASYFGKLIKTLVSAGKYLDNFFQRFSYFNEYPQQAMKAKTFIIGHVMEYYLYNMGMYEKPLYTVNRNLPAPLSEAAVAALKNTTDKDSAWLISFLVHEIIRYHNDEERKTNDKINSRLNIQNKQSNSKLGYSVYLEFLDIQADCLLLEGFACFTGLNTDNLELFMRINDNAYTKCEITSHEEINRYYLGKYISPPWNFIARFPNISKYESIKCRLYVKIDNAMMELKGADIGPFFPVSNRFHESYAMIKGWMAKFWDGILTMMKSNAELQKQQEDKFLSELAHLNTQAATDAIFYRQKYHALKSTLKREVWLLCDRINKADDNGEVFFKFLYNNACQADVYFLLRHDSPDYPRLKQYGKVLDYPSHEHKLVYLLADKIISSHADEFVDNPFFENRSFYQDIIYGKKQVFLQHGIIKDDISGWLNRYNKNLSIFITSAIKERESILDNKYYYNDNIVKLTGMPRYDELESGHEENIILIMPTWRHYLIDDSSNIRNGIYSYGNTFLQSEYFYFYNTLLNNPRLIDSASQYGYMIKFMPHPSLINAMHFFTHHPQVEFCSTNTSYKHLLSSSKLMVTDYSSVAFDFAYLGKPVIYCHFDADTFFANHIYTEDKMHFDYAGDSFGEVLSTLDETIDTIIEYMKNDCQTKDIYRKRIGSFFTFHDRNNCQRVYEEILNLE